MFETKNKLLLIPYFWDQGLYKSIKNNSLKTHKIYLSEHLIFNDFSIITGFIGYPQILTLLNSINNIREKKVFFLGTAGAIKESIKLPVSINITEIFPGSIYKLFSKQKMFTMNSITEYPIKKGSCISVDIPARETKQWLRQYRAKKIDAVEMELFAIRLFMKKSFTAIIIITDIVRGDQKIELMDKKLIKEEFNKSFNLIKNNL